MEYILISSSILCAFFLAVYIVVYNDLKQKHELLQKDYKHLRYKYNRILKRLKPRKVEIPMLQELLDEID